MKPTLHTRYRRLGFALTACLLVLAACDSTNTGVEESAALDDAPLTAAVQTLATDLGLSSEATHTLQAALTDEDGAAPTPGALWQAAADLNNQLTADQKDRLFARQDQQRTQAQENSPHGLQRRGQRGLRQGQGKGRVPLGDLGLTETQKEALQEARTALGTQRRTLLQAKQDGTITDDDFRTQMQALHETMKAETEALFTEAQRDALEAARTTRQGSWESRREAFADRQAAAHAAMVEVLALTAEQQAALEALKAEHTANRTALRDQPQARDRTRASARTTLQAARSERQAALANILTDEQMDITRIHKTLVRHLHRAKAPGRSN